MTIQEFSNEFDVLYNNIMSNQAPGLDEYEKSVLLTKAQDEIVKDYFNPKGNKYQEGFDGSQKRQVDFSMLMKNFRVDKSRLVPPQFTSLRDFNELVEGDIPTTDVVCVPWVQKDTYNEEGVEDIFLIINENVLVNDTMNNNRRKILQVVPIKFDEYLTLMSTPYHRPLKNQAWRILTGNQAGNVGNKSIAFCELHIGYNNEFVEYSLRYLKRPNPIILTDLPEGELSIGGRYKASPCELDPEIHHEILQRAVELGKAAYTGDLKSSVELGQRSE